MCAKFELQFELRLLHSCQSFVHVYKLKEASTHKSAKTHAGTVFVPRDLDL